MRIGLLIIAAACLPAVNAGAMSLDMSTLSCEKFLQTTDSRTLPIVVGWLIGHHSAKNAPSTLDFENADRRSAELLKVCGDNPSITVSAAGDRLHY
jgi:HdeA/HdeB family